MNRNNFNPGLYLVTDRGLSRGREIETIVEAAVRGGANTVQLREKDAPTDEFVEIAKSLKSLLGRYGVPLIINDRVDVALESGAEGVHIGQSDTGYEEARRLLGPERIIGLSVETMEQALEANDLDVDYIGLSGVFPTSTKTDIQSPMGLEGVKKIKEESRHKLVAIGGINSSNAADLMRAGADSLAVVSAICSADDPETEARRIAHIINGFKQGNH